MKKLLHIAFVLWLVSLQTIAEDAYKIIILKGEAFSIDTKNQKKKLHKGDEILPAFQIEASGDVYIAMIKPGGKPLEIKQPGRYSIAKLESERNVSTLSKSVEYAANVGLLMENLGNPEFKIPGMTDAPERAVDNSKLPSFCPKTSSFISFKLKFAWKEMPGTENYKLTLYDISEEKIKEFVIKGTEFELDVRQHLNGENKFIWQVASVEKPELVSKMHLLRYPEGKFAKEAEIELSEIKNELDPNSALSQMILAMFYEKNKMYLEAHNALKLAISLEPNVQEYKDGYRDFLIRVGLENCLDK